MSVRSLIETARGMGARDERAEIRSIIDNTSFGIAALELWGDDPVASRAVASYSRLILQVLDEREAVASGASEEAPEAAAEPTTTTSKR